jgi:para-nitrobenzyl esterase
MPATVVCGAPYVKLSATQKVLAADMVTYWTTFAKTGNPNPTTGTKPPAWPLYGASATMLSLVAGKPAALAASAFDSHHKCSAFWNSATP